MIRTIAAAFVALASVSSLAMLQPGSPATDASVTKATLETDASVTKATLEEVKEVPAEGSLSGYVATQSLVIAEAFCIEGYSELAVWKISKSAILSSETVDGGGAVGDLAWTTLHVDEYDWSLLDGSHPYSAFIGERNAVAALVVGELKGSCGTLPCISLAFDVDDGQGERSHFLIPLVKSPQVVHDTALLVAGRSMFALRAVAENPCSGGTSLYNTYRQRMKDALNAFTQCMKGTVPPVGIAVVACSVGCVPLLAGTPILYALCVAGCTAAVSLPGTAVDLTTCSNELDAAKANAKASYCAGRQYQATHCPNMAEPDAVGCP